MRIQESDIRLSSRHEWESRHEIEVRSEQSFRAVLSDVGSAAEDTAAGRRERLAQLLQSLVDAIIASLEGKKCRNEVADCRPQTQSLPTRPATGEMTWSWQATERIREHESTRVDACGTVKTADGRSIDFNLGLDMCRDYSDKRIYMQDGKVVLHDPLVINFGGKAAELTGERFEFDLDQDGKVECLPGLGAGSCFLVLDRNGNGRADDGGELFGARSGDGFAELAKLDSDANGWLDEADPAFAKLSVWNGGQLAGLEEKGVGAIWLGSVDSPFALKDDANRLLGEIRASGVYLSEDGRVGSVQQVDLAEQDAKSA